MSTSCVLVRSIGECGTHQAKLEGVRVNWDGFPDRMLQAVADGAKLKYIDKD